MCQYYQNVGIIRGRALYGILLAWLAESSKLYIVLRVMIKNKNKSKSFWWLSKKWAYSSVQKFPCQQTSLSQWPKKPGKKKLPNPSQRNWICMQSRDGGHQKVKNCSLFQKGYLYLAITGYVLWLVYSDFR